MKRITMIGDVGWSRFYHLGDEAMTELAIDALRARADIAITLIAGEPQHASEMYGVDAVRRIGFRRDRRPNTSRMKKILDYVAGFRPVDATDEAGDLDRARRERDELAEAKKALEAVHAALAQARARLG